jgi:hypothetical protein
MLRKLWNDDCGAVFATEIVLVTTILVIGIVAGLKAVNLATNDELAELASAIGSISQTYAYCGVSGTCASSNGSRYTDQAEIYNVACTAAFDSVTAANFSCTLP